MAIEKIKIMGAVLELESLKSTISVENMYLIKSPIFIPDKDFADFLSILIWE